MVILTTTSKVNPLNEISLCMIGKFPANAFFFLKQSLVTYEQHFVSLQTDLQPAPWSLAAA